MKQPVYRYACALLLLLLAQLCQAQALREHVVQRGETLEYLAHKYDVSEQDIREQNKSLNLDFFCVGLHLQIPLKESINQQISASFVMTETSTNALLSEANDLYLAGKYKKAAKLYSDAIKKSPQADYYYWRGRCQLSRGKYKSAIADLEQAIYSDDLSETDRNDCSSLLSEAKQRREEQIAARTEALVGFIGMAAVTTATVMQAKAANDAAKNKAHTPTSTTDSRNYSENEADYINEDNNNNASSTNSSDLCLSCYGDKKCSQCHGTGKRTDNLFGTGQDPTHDCGICGGDGICPKCNGAGRISH